MERRRPPGRTRGPLAASLALAAAAHLAALAWLAGRAPSDGPAPGAPVPPPPSFEISLVEEPALPPSPPDAAPPPNDAPPAPAAAARPRQAAAPLAAEASPPGAPAPAAEAPPALSAAGSEAAAPRNFSLGSPTPAFAWGERAALPGPRAEPGPAAAALAALRDALAQSERARGLTTSGPIVDAARAVANAAAAPAEGSTTLTVDVGADGSVSSVAAGNGAWRATADALRSALTGRRLRVPSGASGVSVALRVDARVTNAPRLLTGEEKVKPCNQGKGRHPWPGSPDTAPAPTGCVDADALVPLRRRLVSVTLLRETPR